jgi:hypothetical protein
MPYYRTEVLQDAWIHHKAVVEADSAEDAAHAAYRAWRGDDNGVILVEGDVQGFDHVDEQDPDDVQEITKEEYEAELAAHCETDEEKRAKAIQRIEQGLALDNWTKSQAENIYDSLKDAGFL